MRNVLDAPGFDKPEEEEIKTNFQKWAFRFLLLTIATMIFHQYILVYWMNTNDKFLAFQKVAGILSLANLLFLCFGIFCIILSIAYNEIKNFRFTIAAIGFFIILKLFKKYVQKRR